MSYQLNPPLRTEDESWPSCWPEWVRSALDTLEKIEKRVPTDVLNNTPLWVDKMAFRIFQYMYPTTEISNDTSGPAFLGSTLGHLIWLIKSEDGLSALIARYIEASKELDEKLRKRLSEKEYEELLFKIEKSGSPQEVARIAKSFYRLMLRKSKVMQECLASAWKQELSEQADFFEAYALALKKPPFDQRGFLIKEKSSGISHIYLAMVLNWKFVSKLPSAAKCHAWLCSIFGENVIRDEARIQRMCQAFRVKFSRRNRNKRKKKRKYRR